MLCELRVENLLLIERAELALASGLNVLTGETGAGKTVLAHALDLLMGGRPRGKIVRPGAAEAYVEGVFALDGPLREQIEQLLPDSARSPTDAAPGGDGELILARRVQADGRTRAYVNGRAAGVAELRELGSRVVSFYGQHEHRKLVLASAQLELLDEACGAEHLATRRACEEAHRAAGRLEGELERLTDLAAGRERELDLLEHEIAEIEHVAPDEREHRELLERRERLRRRDALMAGAGAAAQLLSGEGDIGEDVQGAVPLLAAAAAGLGALAGVESDLDVLGERCSALAIEAQELAGELHAHCEGLQGEDESLDTLEERLAALDRLIRKHGGSIEAVLEYDESARRRREELRDGEVRQADATAQLQDKLNERERLVVALRRRRAETASALAEAVREQLAALAMGEASFEIALEPCEPRASGGDAVELTIAPNPGVPPAPLREIASGGELSRVMLALSVAAGRERPEGRSATARGEATLVFDEIDAGIGGHTARAVGERLRGLAESRQLLCITHLPQIASLADRHFSVVKEREGDTTIASVTRLSDSEVLGELVRMLGADERDAGAREHARELLRAA